MKMKNVHGKLWIGPGDEVYQILSTPESPNSGSVGILNVADDYIERVHHRDILYIHAGLNDGPEDWSAPWGGHNSIRAYMNTILALDFLICERNHVYVHCHGGVSRSCFVVAIYLYCVTERSISFDDIERWLKSRYDRCNIHPKHKDKIGDLSYMVPRNLALRSGEYWKGAGFK